MSIELRLLLAGLSSTALALVLTPLAIRIATRLEFFDRPAGYKKHGAPTPYLGGAAVLGAALIPASALALSLDATATAVIVASAVVLWAVGTIDDWRTVTPQTRVLVEIAIATGIWAADLGWDLGSGPAVDLVATAAWLVAVVNAVNLFDNLDGAASTVVAAAAAGLAAIALLDSNAWLAAVAAAVAGSCLGFLRYNLARPARIFLGDGGSMPLGFLLAVGAIAGASSATDLGGGHGVPALAVLLVGLPLFDTALVLVSRRRRGISFLVGGRDHLSHRVLTLVGTPLRVAGVVALVQLGLSAVAIAATQLSTNAVWAAFAAYVALAATAIAWLERAVPPVSSSPATTEPQTTNAAAAP